MPWAWALVKASSLALKMVCLLPPDVEALAEVGVWRAGEAAVGVATAGRYMGMCEALLLGGVPLAELAGEMAAGVPAIWPACSIIFPAAAAMLPAASAGSLACSGWRSSSAHQHAGGCF